MCQLLGLSFNQEIRPVIPFSVFMTRSVAHADGWGLAYYPDESGSAVVFKEPIPGYSSQLADFLYGYRALKSKIFVGHIRRATRGDLKRLGLAVVLIHHGNRNGGYRGHSSKIDNLDTVINLTSLKDTDELCFKVGYDKTRTAKPGDAKSFVVEAIPYPDNPNWLSWNYYFNEQQADATSVSSKDNEIMAYLMQNNVKQREVAEHFDVSQSKISNCWRKAIKAGYVTKEGSITEAGNQFILGLNIQPDGPELDRAA